MNRATTSTTVLPSEQSHFERKLRTRSKKLRAEIRETVLRTDAEQYGRLAGEVHDAQEEALADLFVDVNLAEITRDVQELRNMEAALRRLRAGSYGTCVKCREPIDRQRLEVYPTARRCLPCQQHQDRARGAAAPPSL